MKAKVSVAAKLKWSYSTACKEYVDRWNSQGEVWNERSNPLRWVRKALYSQGLKEKTSNL